MTQLVPSPAVKRILVITLAVVLVGGLVWGIQWATYARPPLPDALEALVSDDVVQVTFDPWLTMTPAQSATTTGFIFYPGGRINPQGYASLMHEIAAQGYMVVIPTMPINMAVFNANIADTIIAQYPDIRDWLIGGHSVGGTMAAQYTNTHPEAIDGLVIWASYPAENADLSDAALPVMSIYGNLDPRVNDESIADRAYLLPEDAQIIRIEGGDHHQFGSYVIKPDEDFATISRASQHNQIIEATLNILDEISPN